MTSQTGGATALGYIIRLLKGTKAPNGVTITEDLITDALAGTYPMGPSRPGNLTASWPGWASHQQRPTTTAGRVQPSLSEEGGRQRMKRHHDQGVELSSTEHLPKRCRLDDSGFYDGSSGGSSANARGKVGAGAAEALSRKVERLAKGMKDKRVRIEADGTETCAFGASCGWETILELKSDSPSGPALIDIIMALHDSSTASEPQPVYVGADLYTKMSREGFGNSKELVHHISPDRPWLFAVREDSPWSAMVINWPEDKIGVYDPQGLRARQRRDRIINHTTSWINHLDDHRTWLSGWRSGPSPDIDDTVNDGIFTALTLCEWMICREALPGVGKAIQYRQRCFDEIWGRVKKKDP